MKRSWLILSSFVAVALACAIVTFSQPTQPGAYGLFSGSSDVGVTFPGRTQFNPYTGVFSLTGSGADMWGTSDTFHFAWVKLKSDATLAADIEFPDKVPSPLAKAVIIFRQDIDPGSPYVDVAIHADGHITMQWRDKAGNITADTVSPIQNSRRLRIERHGDVFTASAQSEDNKMIPFARHTLPMTGPVLAGIGVCSHDLKSVFTVKFSHVTIDRPGM